MSSNMKSITSSHKPLVCKNLQDYLKTLSKETLDKLYNYPATCLAVFRYVYTCINGYLICCMVLLFIFYSCLSFVFIGYLLDYRCYFKIDSPVYVIFIFCMFRIKPVKTVIDNIN